MIELHSCKFEGLEIHAGVHQTRGWLGFYGMILSIQMFTDVAK